MIGRLDQYLPVSGSPVFVEAPADRVAAALQALNERWERSVDSEILDAPFPELLTALEPIDGRRHLIVAGGAWSAIFPAATGNDPTLAWNLARETGARAVFAESEPNNYGDDGGTNTRLEIYDPAVDEDEPIRAIAALRAEKWEFSTYGEPQPWEDPDAYRARRVRDRFPPELINRYLDAIGIPPLDGGGWGPGGYLVSQRPSAPPPVPKRGLLARRRPAPAEQPPLAQTIAELHRRMYG